MVIKNIKAVGGSITVFFYGYLIGCKIFDHEIYKWVAGQEIIN